MRQTGNWGGMSHSMSIVLVPPAEGGWEAHWRSSFIELALSTLSNNQGKDARSEEKGKRGCKYDTPDSSHNDRQTLPKNQSPIIYACPIFMLSNVLLHANVASDINAAYITYLHIFVHS